MQCLFLCNRNITILYQIWILCIIEPAINTSTVLYHYLHSPIYHYYTGTCFITSKWFWVKITIVCDMDPNTAYQLRMHKAICYVSVATNAAQIAEQVEFCTWWCCRSRSSPFHWLQNSTYLLQECRPFTRAQTYQTLNFRHRGSKNKGPS